MAGDVEFSSRRELEKHVFTRVDAITLKIKVGILTKKWIKLILQR